jgi:hypothetical protein
VNSLLRRRRGPRTLTGIAPTFDLTLDCDSVTVLEIAHPRSADDVVSRRCVARGDVTLTWRHEAQWGRMNG